MFRLIWLLNTECNSHFFLYDLGLRENTFFVRIRCLCSVIFLFCQVKLATNPSNDHAQRAAIVSSSRPHFTFSTHVDCEGVESGDQHSEGRVCDRGKKVLTSIITQINKLKAVICTILHTLHTTTVE